MAKDLFEKEITQRKKGKGSMKVYALVLIIVILAAALGFVVYSGSLNSIFGTKISSPNQAASALSGLGNDVNGISEDLKEIDNKL